MCQCSLFYYWVVFPTCMYHSLSIDYQLKNIWVLPSLGQLRIKPLSTFTWDEFLCEQIWFLFSWVGLLDYIKNLCLALYKNVPKIILPFFALLLALYESLLHPCTFDIARFFLFLSHFNRWITVFYCYHLRFCNDKQCRTSFHVLVFHVYNFFSEVC